MSIYQKICTWQFCGMWAIIDPMIYDICGRLFKIVVALLEMAVHVLAGHLQRRVSCQRGTWP